MHTSVLIVGGGPVGLGLAIDLGQRGIRCIVIERYATVHSVPKGQNLTQRTMEHFHFWGAEKALRAARTIPPEYGIGGLTAYGSLLGKYHYDWMQRELVRPYYFTDNERLPQYATEAVLRQRASQLQNVETLYGWNAEDVGQDEQGAYVAVTDRAHGAEGRWIVRASYLVGCDGSRSMVREAAGITQTRSDHNKLMVLLVFRSQELHQILKRFPGKSYYNVLHPSLKGYWQFFGRVDLGTTWFFHAPVPAGTTADNFDFKAYLRKAVGTDFNLELDYVGFWDLRIAIADSYRKEHIFIAGDAAHSHPPYGGYGINTGLEDAVNLGWKLAATLQGWGGPQLLDSYEEERRPVFASTARDFIEKAIQEDCKFLETYSPHRDLSAFERQWQTRQSGAKSEVNAFEPHYEGSSIVVAAGGTPGAVGSHSFAARAGHHLAPQPLSSGGNIFEQLENGFTLLGFDADLSTLRAFEAAAVGLNIPLKVIAESRTGARNDYEAALVLVRPDQFVGWTSEDRAVDAPTILRRVSGQEDFSSQN